MTRTLVSMRALLVSALLFGACVCSGMARAGAIEDLAASMQPGTFAELTAMGSWDNGGILTPLDLGCQTSDYISEYADKAAWDPVHGRVLYLGETHGTCWGGRFVAYTDSTNAWTKLPWITGLCQSGTATDPCWTGHGYDHNTVDPATGDFYWRAYNTVSVYRFRNGSWTQLPSPSMGSHQCCGALEFFPAMHRLLFLDGDWGLWAFDPNANSWTQLANTNQADVTPGLPNLPMASHTNFAVYDPVYKVVLFGGGNYMYKVNATGGISTLRAPPVPLGVTNAVAAVDPAGGNLIVLYGSSSMYEYDVAADSWSQLSLQFPATLSALSGVGDGLLATSIPAAGVIMYIKYNFSGSKVYLYKHSASARKVQLTTPNPPTSVTAK